MPTPCSTAKYDFDQVRPSVGVVRIFQRFHRHHLLHEVIFEDLPLSSSKSEYFWVISGIPDL